ncbi:unnamed protein product [Schistosoma margrebowiei]|uniref:Uncharacterized protein n=1 Tax=Schistosoma margrebowiei TaxID=48269 RepID=A0A183N093_9TREM|nr:unnamed protein product [Schistosoma margrebowiei]
MKTPIFCIWEELNSIVTNENQSKFVNQRVHEIETFFGNLCAELVSYTRRTSKLRNNGDEIARILLDYSNKEQINRTTSDALRKVSEYFVTLEDYRNTEIDRIVGKVVNPLAAYGEEIKHIKNSLKAESAARRREIMNMRKLERSNTVQSSREGGSDADVKARIGKTRAAYLQPRNIWNSKKLSTNTDVRIFNTNVKTVLLYGAETWRTAKATIQKVQQQPSVGENKPDPSRGRNQEEALEVDRTHIEESTQLRHKTSPQVESSRPKEERKTKEHITPGNGDRHEKNEQELDGTRKEGPGQSGLENTGRLPMLH